jgi:hypothetical protein
LITEWSDVKRAAEKAHEAYRIMEVSSQNESLFLDATALNLHGFYSGIEHIFSWLARQLDGTIPQGASWHRNLLAQMTYEVPGARPAVIQASTRMALEAFLGFRHIVRNLYTWNFEPQKVATLIEQLPTTIDALESDFENFARFLDAAGHADTLPEQ